MRTFHELYNPFMALSVLAALRQKFPTALLTMAGQDKGLLTKVQERAALLGLSDAVRFPGFLNEERKKTELVRHDVFINTSRADNSPASLLEAAAAGLVVVSTDVGGIDQMFPRDQAALLVPDDDHEGMAAAIGRVVDDSLLARRLVERGRIVADESNPSRVLGRWEELLREVMDA
jgi:glycosyltransferase involved in cell wall biosynthesis